MRLKKFIGLNGFVKKKLLISSKAICCMIITFLIYVHIVMQNTTIFSLNGHLLLSIIFTVCIIMTRLWCESNDVVHIFLFLAVEYSYSCWVLSYIVLLQGQDVGLTDTESPNLNLTGISLGYIKLISIK